MKKGKKPNGIPIGTSAISLPKPLGTEIKPKRLVFSLQTRWGLLRSMVKPGGDISQGQVLGVHDGGIAPPIIAPCSGKVMGLRSWPSFFGSEVPAIVLQCTGTPTLELTRKDQGTWKDLDPQVLVKKSFKIGIREADPYCWPLAWRLAQPGLPPSDVSNGPDISRPIEYLIVNAIDRQPGVSLRESVLSGRETEIADSISLLERISGARNTILAVRKGQPIADSLEAELGRRAIKVVMCPVIYPIALEPLLVRYITGREIPMPEGDSRVVGVSVVDIVSTLRLYRAVRDGSPSTFTLVQLTIPSANIDSQVWVPEGTLVSELLDQLQLKTPKAAKLIMGGAFLGYAQHTFDVPITAETDSILIQSASEVLSYENRPCISCGFCVKACPMKLLPNVLTRFCEYENFEAAERNFLFHCIECGICAYVCPAKRPMVHLIRFGKREILKARETQ